MALKAHGVGADIKFNIIKAIFFQGHLGDFAIKQNLRKP